MKTESENNNVVKVLKDAAGDLLSEDTLSAIEESFKQTVDTKVEELVSLQVEKALIEQDEDHANKLKALLEAIDVDHTSKLHRVLAAVNENHTGKLKDVVTKYGSQVVEEAGEFKTDLVDRISNYIELYIENAIPAADIKQAVENKQATKQLDEMRKFLAVNFALSKDSIKSAIIDGKKQIQESNHVKEGVLTENNKLKLELEGLQRNKVLEEKTSGLPALKKKYITRVLADKPVSFIEENFDYTLKLFEKTEEDKIQLAKHQVSKTRVAVDRPEPQRVVKESTTPGPDPISVDPFGYMSELEKF